MLDWEVWGTTGTQNRKDWEVFEKNVGSHNKHILKVLHYIFWQE
jgi:hypothetical protein